MLFPVLLAAIVGGAMFGDNLSFISDTTIAATKAQGISMQDKFRVNLRIVFVPAVVTLGIYLLYPVQVENGSIQFFLIDLIKMFPYILVFILAVLGGNVIVILCIALCCSIVIGLATESFTV